MSAVLAITKRELRGYFGTAIAYVFLVIFVALSGVFTFYVGGLFNRGTADLVPFFSYLPWLFLLLIPAVAMRLWAEERKSGTIELLMTLPITPLQAVLGKWLAGSLFIAIALAATFPLWITINILGNPDNWIIISSYIGAFLLAAVLLAVGAAVSAFTRNQVIAFVLAVAMCFLFVMGGTPVVLDGVRAVAPDAVVAMVSNLSALTHYDSFMRGVISLPAVFYIISMLVFWWFANVVFVSLKKAD